MKINKLPNHISFIMDGNNRWSIKNNLSKFESYKRGAQKLLYLSKFLFNTYKIPYVSGFALSKHNMQRSKNFISIILKIINYFLNNYDHFNIDYKIKFIGDLSFIKNFKTLNRIKEIESKNHNSKFTLIFFINYSGTYELDNASKLILKNNKKLFKLSEHLMTKDIPNPDILVRSGGFIRISDFMLYQISFTELFFLKKLWPDLSNSDLKKVIDKYLSLERKFGI